MTIELTHVNTCTCNFVYMPAIAEQAKVIHPEQTDAENVSGPLYVHNAYTQSKASLVLRPSPYYTSILGTLRKKGLFGFSYVTYMYT